MTRIISLIITSVLAFALVWGIFFGGLLEERKKNLTKYQKYVGAEVIINGDTLVVTDYSVAKERFYLSNGAHVNYFYVANRNKDF